MRLIVCEDCKKRYDYDEDEFCPRCGSFNQPGKTWGVDAKGNVVRIDGVNESNHASSFVHSEVHHEKDVRRATGMDWKGSARPAPPPPRPQTPPMSSTRRQQPKRNNALRSVLIFIGIIFLVNFLLPLLVMLFG